MNKIFILYTCHTDIEYDPEIFVKPYAKLESALSVLETALETTKLKLEKISLDEELGVVSDNFTINKNSRSYEIREKDGRRYWEAYIIEEEIQ